MVKKIFFQDVKDKCGFDEDMLGYYSRDRLISALNTIIKKIDKQMQKTYRLKKSTLLFKDDKDIIESYLNERLSVLIDRKKNTIELKKSIFSKGKDISLEEELKNILKSVPEKKE
ncbi:MAG: hypothetical protein WC916_01980 [Candidatus Woesearchaeota archaeon]